MLFRSSRNIEKNDETPIETIEKIFRSTIDDIAREER